MKSLNAFLEHHKKNLQYQRLGQHFVNQYIKGQWPELFYCNDVAKATQMISDWLVDNQYIDQLPQPIS